MSLRQRQRSGTPQEIQPGVEQLAAALAGQIPGAAGGLGMLGNVGALNLLPGVPQGTFPSAFPGTSRGLGGGGRTLGPISGIGARGGTPTGRRAVPRAGAPLASQALVSPTGLGLAAGGQQSRAGRVPAGRGGLGGGRAPTGLPADTPTVPAPIAPPSPVPSGFVPGGGGRQIGRGPTGGAGRAPQPIAFGEQDLLAALQDPAAFQAIMGTAGELGDVSGLQAIDPLLTGLTDTSLLGNVLGAGGQAQGFAQGVGGLAGQLADVQGLEGLGELGILENLGVLGGQGAAGLLGEQGLIQQQGLAEALLAGPEEATRGLFSALEPFEQRETERQVAGLREAFGTAGGRFSRNLLGGESMLRGELANQFNLARQQGLLGAEQNRIAALNALLSGEQIGTQGLLGAAGLQQEGLGLAERLRQSALTGAGQLGLGAGQLGLGAGQLGLGAEQARQAGLLGAGNLGISREQARQSGLLGAGQLGLGTQAQLAQNLLGAGGLIQDRDRLTSQNLLAAESLRQQGLQAPAQLLSQFFRPGPAVFEPGTGQQILGAGTQILGTVLGGLLGG